MKDLKLQSVDQIRNHPPAILAPREDQESGPVVAAGGVTLLSGEPGVGKTAAALHWARALAGLPDNAAFGDFRPAASGLNGRGGPVLYVSTDSAPQLISAHLRALLRHEAAHRETARRETANGRDAFGRSGNPEECLARIHVLDLCDEPLYRNGAKAAGGWFRRQPAGRGGAEETNAWKSLHEAAVSVRPRLIILNEAKLGRPASAEHYLRSARALLDSIRLTPEEGPLPGFLLLAHSSEGAYKSSDPNAYPAPEAPWSAVLTLARARSPKHRVLRLAHSVHGPAGRSIRLRAICAGGEGAAPLGFASEGGWARGAYGARTRPKKAAAGSKAPEGALKAADAQPALNMPPAAEAAGALD